MMGIKIITSNPPIIPWPTCVDFIGLFTSMGAHTSYEKLIVNRIPNPDLDKTRGQCIIRLAYQKRKTIITKRTQTNNAVRLIKFDLYPRGKNKKYLL